ncbi:hypothetical protein Bbelb_329930 [Branchiostoma belcheri]|nr:hypothetical protein Bbelb_329930 [Branchiostoma belcheri]
MAGQLELRGMETTLLIVADVYPETGLQQEEEADFCRKDCVERRWGGGQKFLLQAKPRDKKRKDRTYGKRGIVMGDRSLRNTHRQILLENSRNTDPPGILDRNTDRSRSTHRNMVRYGFP